MVFFPLLRHSGSGLASATMLGLRGNGQSPILRPRQGALSIHPLPTRDGTGSAKDSIGGTADNRVKEDGMSKALIVAAVPKYRVGVEQLFDGSPKTRLSYYRRPPVPVSLSSNVGAVAKYTSFNPLLEVLLGKMTTPVTRDGLNGSPTNPPSSSHGSLAVIADTSLAMVERVAEAVSVESEIADRSLTRCQESRDSVCLALIKYMPVIPLPDRGFSAARSSSSSARNNPIVVHLDATTYFSFHAPTPTLLPSYLCDMLKEYTANNPRSPVVTVTVQEQRENVITLAVSVLAMRKLVRTIAASRGIRRVTAPTTLLSLAACKENVRPVATPNCGTPAPSSRARDPFASRNDEQTQTLHISSSARLFRSALADSNIMISAHTPLRTATATAPETPSSPITPAASPPPTQSKTKKKSRSGAKKSTVPTGSVEASPSSSVSGPKPNTSAPNAGSSKEAPTCPPSASTSSQSRSSPDASAKKTSETVKEAAKQKEANRVAFYKRRRQHRKA